MQAASRERGYLTAYDGGGAASKPNADGYVTLDADDHYFVLGGAEGAPITSVQIQTDATIAGTFTIEICNFPRDPINGGGRVSDYDETTAWVLVNASTGVYIPTNGTGWTVTAMTMAKTAGLGSAIVDIGNLGAKRVRVKAAITTPGLVRVNGNAKS